MVRDFIIATVLMFMLPNLSMIVIMLLTGQYMVTFRVAIHHSCCGEALEGYRHKHDAQQKESEQLFHGMIIAQIILGVTPHQNGEYIQRFESVIYLADWNSCWPHVF